MTATTTAPALPEVPSTTPAWLPKLVALLLLIAGPVLAYLDPDGKIKSGLVQAVIILVFVVVAAAIFTVHLILENGLSKTGITKTITEEEAWVRAHAAELQSTFNAAKPALDAIPGVPAALAAANGEISSLKARFDALPPEQQVDLDAVAETAKNKVFAALAANASQSPAPVAAPAPAVATAQTPLPAPPAPPAAA